MKLFYTALILLAFYLGHAVCRMELESVKIKSQADLNKCHDVLMGRSIYENTMRDKRSGN